MNELPLHVQGRIAERLGMAEVLLNNSNDEYRRGWRDALLWIAKLIGTETGMPKE